MADFKFNLANMGGCYVGIEAINLKMACDIYSYLVRVLHQSNNSVVDMITKTETKVITNGTDKT